MVSARRFGLAAASALLLSLLLAAPVAAKAACNNGGLAGTADVAVTQSIAHVAVGSDLIDDVTLTNLGPCNIPAASLRVTLPSGATYVSFTSNPSAWACTAAGSVITCSETNTIGVPGTADINIRFTPGSGTTVVACGSGGTDQTSCPTADPATPPDPNPGNNLSYAGLVGAGGSVTYGPNGSGTPNSGFDHTTSVTLTNGGLVNIYQATSCPSDVNDCFLGTATVSTAADGSKTFAFTFLASLTSKPLTQITIWFSSGGKFTPVNSCKGKAADPCVLSRAKSTANGLNVYTIVVSSTVDSGWTAD